MEKDIREFTLKEDLFFTDEKLRFFYELSVENVINLMNVRPGMKILNLGCGRNIISSAVSDRGGLVTSVDESRELIDSLKKNNKIYGMDFMRMDFSTLHFPEDFFDISLCMFSYEFADNPRKVFSELMRVTKKYGSVIIAFINLDSRWPQFIRKKSMEFRNLWINAEFRNRGFILSLDGERLEIIKSCNFISPYFNSERFTINDERAFSGKETPGVVIARWRKE